MVHSLKHFLWILAIITSITLVTSLTEYTPSSDRICNNGKCTLTLYSGTRNVYENNEWKRIEDAQSLKDKDGLFINISLDERFNITLIDYNYTSYQVCISSNETGLIPITVYRHNETNYSQIINEVYAQIFNPVPDIERCYLIKLQHPIFAYTVKWGWNSTELILQDADIENLEDTYLSFADGNSNYGGTTILQSLALQYLNNYKSFLIKFNISGVPGSVDIENSVLHVYMASESIDTGEEYHLDAHHYYNQTWVETEPTYNNMVSDNNYNSTYDSRWTCTGADPNPDAPNWVTWDVTNSVNSEYNNESNNISIWMRTVYSSGTPANDHVSFYSKEYSTASLRPYLNITYIESGDTCTCPDNVSENWEIDMTNDCVLNTDCSIGNVTFINSGTFTCNSTLNAPFVEELSSGQMGLVTVNCRGVIR